MRSQTRLALGPINQCGQPTFWAAAARNHLSIDAVSFAPAGWLARRVPGANLQGRADRSIPHRRLSVPAWRKHRIQRILAENTHVMVESLVPVLSGAADGNIGEDLPHLRNLGLEVSVVLHGSEIRNPWAHLARHKVSYFSEAPPDWVNRIAARVIRNQALLPELGLPLFVSTPDLLIDVPQASWLPLSIDVEEWNGGREVFNGRDLPVVLHLPSQTDPPIKGTRYIQPILEELERKGRIIYLRPDSVPHSQMRALVHSADVVVDQILTGSYGVAAIEAMAAGRVVVGYIDHDTRAQMPEPPPIVQGSPDELMAAIEALLDDPVGSRDRAARGAAYARRWHDGRAAARVLGQYLGVDASG